MIIQLKKMSILLVLTFSFLAFVEMRSYAQDVVKVEMGVENFCDAPNAKGYIFYKFEKIYVYFPRYIKATSGENYLEIFDAKHFRSRVEKTLKESFSPCLKMSNGQQKEIILTSALNDEMFNPSNLLVLVDFSYPYKDLLYVEDMGAKKRAHLQTSIFRAGLSPKEAFSAVQNTRSFTFDVENVDLGTLEVQLNNALMKSLSVYRCNCDKGARGF